MFIKCGLVIVGWAFFGGGFNDKKMWHSLSGRRRQFHWYDDLFLCDPFFPANYILVRMVFIQWRNYVANRIHACPTPFIPPLIASPQFFHFAVSQMNTFLINERLPTEYQLLLASCGLRKNCFENLSINIWRRSLFQKRGKKNDKNKSIS